MLLPLKSDERFSRIYTKKLGGVAAYYVDFYRCDSYLKALINSSDTVSTGIPRFVRTSNSALSISAQKQILTTPRFMRIINSISAHGS